MSDKRTEKVIDLRDAGAGCMDNPVAKLAEALAKIAAEQNDKGVFKFLFDKDMLPPKLAKKMMERGGLQVIGERHVDEKTVEIVAEHASRKGKG